MGKANEKRETVPAGTELELVRKGEGIREGWLLVRVKGSDKEAWIHESHVEDSDE